VVATPAVHHDFIVTLTALALGGVMRMVVQTEFEFWIENEANEVPAAQPAAGKTVTHSQLADNVVVAYGVKLPSGIAVYAVQVAGAIALPRAPLYATQLALVYTCE